MWLQEPWVRPQGDISMRRDTVSVIWHLLFLKKCSTKTPNTENRERRCGLTISILGIEVSTGSMEAEIEIANCNCFEKIYYSFWYSTSNLLAKFHHFDLVWCGTDKMFEIYHWQNPWLKFQKWESFSFSPNWILFQSIWPVLVSSENGF